MAVEDGATGIARYVRQLSLGLSMYICTLSITDNSMIYVYMNQWNRSRTEYVNKNAQLDTFPTPLNLAEAWAIKAFLGKSYIVGSHLATSFLQSISTPSFIVNKTSLSSQSLRVLRYTVAGWRTTQQEHNRADYYFSPSKFASKSILTSSSAQDEICTTAMSVATCASTLGYHSIYIVSVLSYLRNLKTGCVNPRIS